MSEDTQKLPQSKIIWIATWAEEKGYEGDDVYYSDYLYGHEDQAGEVFQFMRELKEIGKIKFYKKYKEFNLY